jgi:hypothetical protein
MFPKNRALERLTGIMNRRMEARLILAFMVCLLLSFLFSLAYRYDNQRVMVSGNERDFLAGKGYEWSIDNVTKSSTRFEITGWVAKIGRNLIYENRSIVLIDPAGQLYELHTVMEKRTDVTHFFKDGFNYDNSGIGAICTRNALKSNEIYMIGIIVTEQDGSKYLIKTDKTLVGG